MSVKCEGCGVNEGCPHKNDCRILHEGLFIAQSSRFLGEAPKESEDNIAQQLNHYIFYPSFSTKDTNPKDAVGIKKTPFSTVSGAVIAEIGIAMLEGARKYGRHNYRVSSIRFSVYYDAAFRHLTSWWEGQDNDPDSGLSHITKALASLTVLRDAMIQGKIVDDRPPVTPAGWEKKCQNYVNEIFEKYPEAKAAFTQEDLCSTAKK